ncbi:MAG: cytochrome c family protein [Pseudomonadota bacterium]|nr:cytochrome c family protein [Pseudomonadota bacterium]
MQDHKNTIAGWVLFAGIIVLGASIVTGEVFHSGRPETMGYPIEGVVLAGDAAAVEAPINFAVADAAKGEQVFKKCAACHNVDPGGANAIGPALYGVMGKPIAAHPGFAFSDALKSAGGSWGWDNMSAWLANPKKFAPGTKMSFAGLSNPEDRANVIAFLNSRSASPLPVPAAPAAAAPAEGAAPEASPNAAEKAAAETAIGGGAEKAPNQPVLNQVDAEKGGPKNSGGDAAKVAQ